MKYRVRMVYKKKKNRKNKIQKIQHLRSQLYIR